MFVPKAACTCRILAIAATAIILAGLNVPMATAQVLYGSMVGNVRDTSEASVPGADVTVRNMADNQARSALTNESGSFYLLPCRPESTKSVSQRTAFVRQGARESWSA